MSNSEAAEPYTIIEPLGGPLAGDVSVPGDKSISHRAVTSPLKGPPKGSMIV